jgi:hypothetical protein
MVVMTYVAHDVVLHALHERMSSHRNRRHAFSAKVKPQASRVSEAKPVLA